MREVWRRSWPVVLLAALIAAVYLAAGAAIFPMDDAYIHAVYARNLAEHHRLTFNLNPPDAGLGTTSILWPLLLAALHPVLQVVAAARLLGVASYLAVAFLSVEIAGWMVPREARRASRLPAAAVVMSGNLVWFSLSGMETMLWLAFGLGALVAWRHRRLALAGVLLGLAMLTRIEGVVLLAAMVAVELVAERRPRRELVVLGVLAVLLLSPWLAFVHARTGHWLPTSYAGKKHAQVRGAVQTVNETLGQSGDAVELEADDLPAWTVFLYPLGVLAYGVAFVAGGAYLPGPRLVMPGQLGAVLGGLSYAGFLALLAVFLPLFGVALRPAARVLRPGTWDDHRRRALAVLALWFLGHNLAYWLKLPTPGTASRYQVVNHVAWWLLAGVGAWRLSTGRRPLAAALVLGLAAANCGYWYTVYASDVRHMRDVRLAAAEYLRASLPADAVVAAHDIGALGWRMNRRCVDLGGLIDPAWLAAARAGRQADFLRREGAGYLVLPNKHSSEAEGFFDYAAFLGLKDNPRIRLDELRSFENDWADWARGAAPTWNALPAVTVYRFLWNAP